MGAVMTSMRMRLVSDFTVFLPTLDFCTCQLRLAFVFQLCAGVGGGIGGRGANAASVFCFFCCVASPTLPVAL